MDEYIPILGTTEAEKEFGFYPDKLDPSLLMTNADHHNFLQSLPELHR
jgi:hypothetical protein